MSVRSSKSCLPQMAEFRLTPAAERDLESIWTYTVQHWGVEQANYGIAVVRILHERMDAPRYLD
jgi:toxin ParE1/3/4